MFDVIIIGAGTAGLSARKEVSKYTDNYLIVDKYPHGTTCALSGCMPSKVLIEESQKILNSKRKCDLESKAEFRCTMHKVRSMRDYFVKSILDDFNDWKEHFIEGEARFLSQNSIEINNKEYSAQKIIIAVGSRPKTLNGIQESNVLNTDKLFEIEEAPKAFHLIGLGSIGLELGQALSNIGVKVSAYSDTQDFIPSRSKSVKDYAKEYFENQFSIHYSTAPEKIPHNEMVIQCVGRVSNLDQLNIEKVFETGIDKIIKNVNKAQMCWKEHPHIFICGDANEDRTILHEAEEEGRIAGYNATNKLKSFERLTPMHITFTSPQLASLGKYNSIASADSTIVSSVKSFENQGRSRVKGENNGLIEIFMNSETEEIVGAELFCPDAEYMAHFLSQGMAHGFKRKDYLKTPFYHPTTFEGLKSALINL